MAHPIHIVRRVCAEKGVDAADLLAALLHPLTGAHVQMKGFRADEPAGKAFTPFDEIKDLYRKMEISDDQPGTLLTLLALMNVKHGVVLDVTGMPDAANQQAAVVYLLHELMKDAEAEGKAYRQRVG
jgi:hypothetical protein